MWKDQTGWDDMIDCHNDIAIDIDIMENGERGNEPGKNEMRWDTIKRDEV